MELKINTSKEEYPEALITKANLCIPSIDDKGIASWDKKLIEFVQGMKDLLASMPAAKALAANQGWSPEIGIPIPNLFVMKIDDYIQEFINPMAKGTGKSIKMFEGCMSFPEKQHNKRRHKNVTILFQTLEDPSKQPAIKFSGLDARAAQHEVDHLRGKCLFKLKTKKHNGC